MSKTDTGTTVTEEMTLPQKFKEKWIDGLRDHKYEQTEEILYDCGAFCALGVACHHAGNVKISEIVGLASIENNFIKKHNLPKEFGNQDLQDWIIELNDNEYWNFDAIADWIEDNVEAI